MAVTWQTPPGSLGIVTERIALDIPLEVLTDQPSVTLSLLAGSLPRGLRLENGRITGSPVEVVKFTESKFVIRADDGIDKQDRTFSISVDGSDNPYWITKEGFLNVGPNNAYYVLDNSYVEFYLEAEDPDVTAGDTLEFYISPLNGELPPGLTLDRDGRIHGYTDPIFAVEYNGNPSGAYDTSSFDTMPLDVTEARSNGFDSYLYDDTTFDFTDTSRTPRRLSRFYTFVVTVSDGRNETKRLFRIYVVTEEFLQADNSIVQVDTNLFQADASSYRVPLWITESDLGRHRANNYLTIFLDVYRAPGISGSLIYFLKSTNPDNTASTLPPGMAIDQLTGEIAGKVPFQSATTKTYTFTVSAVNFLEEVASMSYTLRGVWDSLTTYFKDDAVVYNGFVWVCREEHRNRPPSDTSAYWIPSVAYSDKTFTIDLIGEIESAIHWLTDSDLGSIKPNRPSTLNVEAESLLYGNKTVYELTSGTLPPGLTLLSTGLIQGKVKQFADSTSNGLTRFYSVVDGQPTYATTFDSGETTFDKVFKFDITARDTANFARSRKTFTVTVIEENNKTFANLYVKALQAKEKRLDWFNFITNFDIFNPDEIYRYGDENFGITSEIKVLIYAGIESTEAVKYVQAMSRNHYRKRLQFGDVKYAKAKDPATQETIYEVVYVEVVDSLEKNGTSISRTVDLPNDINSKVLISYDAIKVDSDIPLVSDSDHQRVFPNSVKNMRKQMRGVGDRDREFLPLWMRSIQDNSAFEPGYVKALPLCYVLPGKAESIIARINLKTTYASRGEWSKSIYYLVGDSVNFRGSYYTCITDNQNQIPGTEGSVYWSKNFDFKSIDLEADRYQIDVLDGEFEDKYLAFPQRGEKLP